MNYKKIYKQLIDKAKNENRDKKDGVYYELHHIIPKCMGGTNDPTNLILLSAREHFISHALLVKMYPENHKLLHAINYMMNDNGYGRIENLSKSRLYELFRNRYSQYLKDTRMVIDDSGDIYRVDKNDIRLKNGELNHVATIKPSCSGYVHINKNGNVKRIPHKDIEIYSVQGWKLGSTKPKSFYENMAKGQKRINKNGEEKSVHESELQTYLKMGWKIGSLHSSTKNTSWVTNGIENKMIPINDIKKYLSNGWAKGLKRKSCELFKCINNGIEEKRVNNEKELNKYLSDGWILGRLCKTNKGRIWIVKDNNVKMIEKKELNKYKKDGWSKGFKSKKPPK